jgi:Xaa-Pro aminopeptidase
MVRMTIKKWTVLLIVVLACLPGMALTHMGIDSSEFQRRRQSVMNAASDGIILLHSFSAPKSWSDSGFRQDSNFYYLTGLENLHDAILAVDGTTKESWLFVMAPTERQQRRFDSLSGWDSVYLTPNHETEQALGIEHIVAWDGFADFIETRRKANPKILLYLDQSGEGKMVADVSNPPSLAAIENPYLLWAGAIKAKWPDANIADATSTLQNIRAVKSPAEIALMKKAAVYTDAGFRAAVAAIAPGHTNREIEGAAIEAALRAGADGRLPAHQSAVTIFSGWHRKDDGTREMRTLCHDDYRTRTPVLLGGARGRREFWSGDEVRVRSASDVCSSAVPEHTSQTTLS